MVIDHEPVTTEKFRGLYGRGAYEDTVPSSFFIDSLNTDSVGDEIKTRDGFRLSNVTLPNIRRIWEYKRQGEASRIIVLNDVGQFFDYSISATTPILTVASATDFSAISQYNRAYISPHNGVTGITGEFVYVYNGAGLARKAGGAAPAGGFNVAVSAVAGNVEAGLHIFGVQFETDSGFVTAPGQLKTLTVDGTKSVDVSSIPLGPTGTAARRIIASRAIQAFNGDLEGYELFSVPNGRIPNNTTESLTINFYDADLQQTVDYSFDQLDFIPSVVNIISYGTRLAYLAPQLNPSMAHISKAGEPESVNELSGFLLCGPTEAEGLKSGCEFRDSLYLTKSDKLYATRENGYDPSTWAVMDVDKGIGADVFSLSVIQDNKGANIDFFLLGARSGLYIYNGTVVKPELTFNILNWWKRINTAYFHKVQVMIDTDNFKIYCLVPLDAATSCSHLIVGDYTEGLNHQAIKWHIWNSVKFMPECISVSISNVTKKTFLRVGGRAGSIYNQTVNEKSDDFAAIDTYLWTNLDYVQGGWVHHCGGLTLRVNGSGNLQLSVKGQDSTEIVNYNDMTLAVASGREFFRHINFNNERVAIKLRTSYVGEFFNLKKIINFLKPTWASRPS